MILVGEKKPTYYNDILIKADLGLHEQIASIIQDLEPPVGAPRILDLGAGEGALSQRMVDLGYQLVAADMDGATFKCQEASFYQVNFDRLGEVRTLSERYADYFDIVMGVEVIEHVENPWEYVRLLCSMLRPGGRLLVTTPNTTSWLSRLIFLFSGRFHQFQDSDLSYGHISPISAWELENIFRSLGLQEISVRPAGTLPLIWIQRSRRIALYNVLALLLRPFMFGVKDGWCILAIARKP